MLARASAADLIARREVPRVLASLPAKFRTEAAACRIELCAMPDFDDPGDDLLGLFEGLARHEGPPQSADELPRIRLFIDNLWQFSRRNPQLFRAELRITLLHELGHYLGFEEEDMERLGLA
jgi:predicted Zn-dependent protease with MMP-like domain